MPALLTDLSDDEVNLQLHLDTSFEDEAGSTELQGHFEDENAVGDTAIPQNASLN